MRNPVIKIFVFILALAAGLSGVWFLRLMMFPTISEIGILTTHNPAPLSPQRAEIEPVKPYASKLRPCDAGDDFRWDKRWRGSGTIQDGILNGKIRCGVLPQFSQTNNLRNIGWVSVNILVDYDGRVIRAKGRKGNPLLMGEAITAAYQTRFAPRLLGGKSYRVKGILMYKSILQNGTTLQNPGITEKRYRLIDGD